MMHSDHRSARGSVPQGKRLRVAIRGAVQGVGFRPFLFRLATELGLQGWVNNSAQGVFIEVEGQPGVLENFLLRLEAEKPPRSFIQSLEASWLDPVGYTTFEIRPSDAGGAKIALVLPDIATCPDCLREIFDPADRRHFYPFTNCTNCGPRFSIIEALPYDRANTSMKQFTMCPQCLAEYDNPRDRRFHAQPNACPVCGPHLELWNRAGEVLARDNHAALTGAAEALRAGKILAVKGLGGFHLMVAAHDPQAVQRLRERKHREEKPFALMFPALDAVKSACAVSSLEERLLRSPEAPIVLLRRSHSALPASLAPGNPNLGVMLPYTPLHHLLLALLNFPVVATSGNLSDEPICIEEYEALERLGGMADLFLGHNRPIVRHVDDSIVRVMAGRELVLRRARGYAPLPVTLQVGTRSTASHFRISEKQLPTPNVLAVGAHLKNAIALAVGPQAFISQHIGDLETDQAFEAFRRVIADFQKLYEAQPALIAADAHPDYLSTKFARDISLAPSDGERGSLSTDSSGAQRRPDSSGNSQPSLAFVSVQHHVAHVLSCMAENELKPPLLGVSWDGTGYGLDGTVWGGEFFQITESACERVAHLRPFRLPGGDKAVKQPRRTALGLLYEIFGAATFDRHDLAPVAAFSPTEAASLKAMLMRQLNSPLTSSVGRLFDAVASLVGLRQQVRFEGQAAMELEFALEGFDTDDAYPFPVVTPARNSEFGIRSSEFLSAFRTPRSPLRTGSSALLDWFVLVEAILRDLSQKVPLGLISMRFHNALVEAMIEVARRVGCERVALSGGCFQNRFLTERAIQRLQAEGFRPYWHQRVPPNDGGIALGQVVAARRQTV